MLNFDDEDEWVVRAAAPVRAMISELHEGAPAELAPVLAHLRDHALDPGYSVKVLKTALEIHGNELMVEVTRWAGVPPGRLIVEVRMVTTAELLRVTELEVETIAWRVGYAEAKSLRRMFQAWSGMSPSEYRRRSRRAEALAGPPPPGSLSLLFWRRVYAGEMEREVVEEVLAYLERLSSLPEDGDAGGEGDAFMTDLTAALGAMLEPLPWLEQREAARYAIRCASPCFFEHLSARSRAAARRGDLKRAAELAELALDSVEATEELVGEPDPERRALAWARLARARCRAGDAAGAEKAAARLARVLAELPADGQDARLTAERLFVEADLRALQGRDVRALELAAEALELARGGAVPRELTARARLLRARLRLRAPDEAGPDDARADLAATLPLLEAELPETAAPEAEAAERAELLAELLDVWARVHARRGEVDVVAAVTPRLRSLAAEVDGATGADSGGGAPASRRARCAARSWQAWVDRRRGDLSRAERGWQRARTGFAELGEAARSARITVELADLALTRGRREQAWAWARELLAEVTACGVAREELPALAALSRAVESGALGPEVLEPVRRSLERLL